MKTGMRVMNAFLLASTERDHAKRLLELMRPEPNVSILDAGCGIGAVAALMRELRPDLSFTLLNLSAQQLEHCPDGMERMQADFDHIPLADESVDVVMFNFSLCHSNEWLVTLREARRVLREGGVLFVFDMARRSGDNLLMEKVLQAAAYPARMVCNVARRAGFTLEPKDAMGHVPAIERLRSVMPETYDAVVGDVIPATWRFVRDTVVDPVASAFARHERIGFQFSGGRDSTAALYLLRPYWSRMTIYHLDTGDQFPETRAVVQAVELETGPMVRITTDVKAFRQEAGLASDLVPVDNTPIGRLVSGRAVKLVSRYDCCAQNLMLPMHRKLLEDGNTLIIRGQRDDEYAEQPLRSGDVESGLEVLYPIQDWTGPQVSSYLKDNGHPIAPFYERGALRAPECMGCTAWWDEGRAAYLQSWHPVKYSEYGASMRLIRSEIDRQYATL